jgi:hypothetical protein
MLPQPMINLSELAPRLFSKVDGVAQRNQSRPRQASISAWPRWRTFVTKRFARSGNLGASEMKRRRKASVSGRNARSKSFRPNAQSPPRHPPAAARSCGGFPSSHRRIVRPRRQTTRPCRVAKMPLTSCTRCFGRRGIAFAATEGFSNINIRRTQAFMHRALKRR